MPAVQLLNTSDFYEPNLLGLNSSVSSQFEIGEFRILSGFLRSRMHAAGTGPNPHSPDSLRALQVASRRFFPSGLAATFKSCL